MAMDTGPYVNVAVFCDSALIGNDGTLSIIRIVDTVTQTATGADPPDEMPPFVVNTKLVIVLKAGKARGRFKIRLRPEGPDGRSLPDQDYAIHLDGGHSGINLLADVQFAVAMEGTYWFDVVFVAGRDEERQLTRVPLRVLYQPQKT